MTDNPMRNHQQHLYETRDRIGDRLRLLYNARDELAAVIALEETWQEDIEQRIEKSAKLIDD